MPSHLTRFALAATLLGVALTACAGEEPEDAEAQTSALEYNASFGNRIAGVALRVDGRGSGGMCLAEVQNSLERAGVRAFPRLPGAVDLDNFMRAKGGERG